ncbi:MAG: 3-deoxy-7-phosphoheptulonate synthase, partial [Spirochaetales bacterium]|nr:3-deoxy-7-phosphoheptulonate synthase [Spirochaetales bacterium]
GGAYKPRSSPYSFQGLGEKGLRYLKDAGDKVGLPVSSEIVSTELLPMMKDYVDVFQVGTRNMQNFELLKALGKAGKPVILKRGQSATMEEWLMAAEYIMVHGTDDVILCERGIRTFETYTRNTLDLSAIPVVKKLSHLPVIVDPSHGTGLRDKVPPMSLAAIAAGADGLILEVHTDPDKALSDGAQTLYPEQFEKLMRDIKALSPVIGKEIERIPEPVRTKTAKKGKQGGAGEVCVAFQGERGAYSELAIHGYYGEKTVGLLPCSRFRDVFDAVLEGKADFGMLPVENALAGSVHENYDLLLDYPDLKIIGEKKIRIEHNLIGLPDAGIEDIRFVYSHPQGLAQSSEFLESLGNVQQIPFYDTAGSVAHIAREGKKELAAIASGEAARVYGMKILKAGVETNPRNYTRFVVVSRKEYPDPQKKEKGSILFSVSNNPGALFTCLKILAERGINLCKLESRPIHGKPWEYMFYVDVELPANFREFEDSMNELQKQTVELRLLGVYAV